MIIIIRHAQSEGNKNRDIHQMIPDHRVKLTDEGKRQVGACPSLHIHATRTHNNNIRQKKLASDYGAC